MQKARGRENLIIKIIPKVRTGRFMTVFEASIWVSEAGIRVPEVKIWVF